MKLLSSLCVVFAFVLQSEYVFAENIWGEVRRFKDDLSFPVTTGAVCEQLAKVSLQKLYPESEYFIETGIEYYHQHGHTVGELDVVVFDRSTQEAILVGEVKCWKDLESASKKARKQRRRFKEILADQERETLTFSRVSHREIQFATRQFDLNVPYILISQEGGGGKGFDFTLNYSLEELQAVSDILTQAKKLERKRLKE